MKKSDSTNVIDHDDPLVTGRHTLNPYTGNGIAILRRLRWDINPKSWISRRKLRGWKNKSQEKKAIILCNGPSLNKVNVDLLPSDCFTFGLNKINLLFDRSTFRPSCIVAVNPFVIEQNKDFYNTTNIPLFLDSVATVKGWVESRKNLIFLHSSSPNCGFARDCSMSINQGHTVTYVALQLAFHMGFKSVALVGADHTFATKGPANKTVLGGSRDESHFDPRYFANVQWQLPDLLESEMSYHKANNMYNAHGREIFNCTDGGKLEIFDRLSLDNFLNL
ncbi:MAG: DUF115 domain-containing protein [Candidatus Electrothrix sp. AR4]|nr:DUF115 domain-containing protein [Candidatus Electrothrix sp. AR4]